MKKLQLKAMQFGANEILTRFVSQYRVMSSIISSFVSDFSAFPPL
ncbi:hypothetical protein [Chitinophaga polysaccharea]|nr:hypothetical protein [Chitinophaga polysaccharea]